MADKNTSTTAGSRRDDPSMHIGFTRAGAAASAGGAHGSARGPQDTSIPALADRGADDDVLASGRKAPDTGRVVAAVDPALGAAAAGSPAAGSPAAGSPRSASPPSGAPASAAPPPARDAGPSAQPGGKPATAGSKSAQAQAAPPASVPPPAPERDDAPRRRRGGVFAVVLVIVLLLILGAFAYLAQQRWARFEQEAARRLQTVESRAQQGDQQLRAMQETIRDVTARNNVLEQKLAETVGEQAQLRQFYDQFVRSRGDSMLADVEQSLMLAIQQLQLSGNVQSALIALQDAEQRLAQSNQPAMMGLRRVLARDIERLKALPIADHPNAIGRLDSVVSMIDQFPMAADVQPANVPAPQAEPGTERTGLAALSEKIVRTGVQSWDSFLKELRQLFRVQRVDNPDAMLAAPEQRYFARENLRLLLLNARLDLLARNEPLFRADINRAIEGIERYFDRDAKSVQSALGTLRQLQNLKLTLEAPTLSESLTAVRAARSAAETR